MEVVSDSTYVVNCFRQRWWAGWHRRDWRNAQGKPVANRDLWEPLLALALGDEAPVSLALGEGPLGRPLERGGRPVGPEPRPLGPGRLGLSAPAPRPGGAVWWSGGPARTIGAMELNGISAIVTGGASGLGAATARALGAEGVRVTVFDRNDEGAKAVAAEVGGNDVAGDVTEPDGLPAGGRPGRRGRAACASP